ncbi:hypothetical protein HZA99_05520 [Candidatus Woesearchaeota archaeon]|nr:hypothetical protein [Candidatus Woesearchaeota archaeon]
MIAKVKLKKKAELTTETMVLIALALIFLIIVAFVMTGKIKIFSKGLGDCESKSGKCMDKGSCYGTVTGFDCSDAKECCILQKIYIPHFYFHNLQVLC